MSFKEIVGQEEVKKLLQKSIFKKRIASSYLFCGPEGIGKTLTAFTFAKALNCKVNEGGSCTTENSEDSCTSCRKIDSFSHPDIHVIFPMTKKARDENKKNYLLKNNDIHMYQKTEEIIIDDIRSIEEQLIMKPFEAIRRIVIIVDAETMNSYAQNALLKILEEPPIDTTIILTSSQPERLFSTIKSRCLRVVFKRLKREEVKEYLQAHMDADESELELISFLSDGSLKKAKLFFDDERREERKLLTSIVMERNFENLSEVYEKNTLERFVNFIIPLMRDINSSQCGGKIFNIDLEPYIHSVEKEYSSEEIKETIEFLGDAINNIKRNVNPQLISNVVYDTIRK
jgi:DNA polymerase-3 subunit delta'